MVAQIAKLIGGAGTGKTTELMRIIGEVIAAGVDPMDIGFVSFTRAARAEAAQRVEAEFGVAADDLQKLGWFRTLHSVCYQALGGGRKWELLTDNKDSREWIENAIQEAVVGATTVSEHDLPDLQNDTSSQSPAAIALAMWAIARNKLISLREAYDIAQSGGFVVTSFEHVHAVVSKYERQKYLDDRVDFADLAGRFAGWRWSVDEEPWPCEVDGVAPDLPVWFFDEHQDVSRLLHSVSLRLIDQPSCRWAYFAGDPFQALYGFSGADHHCFMESIEADKVRTMEQSFRCPAGVLSLGEQILRRCSDYFDRGIKPASMAHGVDATHQFVSLLGEIDPTKESWLFIARTNMLARRFYKPLEREGIPWDYTRGSGGYCTPTTRLVASGLSDLQAGKPISPDAWRSVLSNISAGSKDSRLIERGVKTSVAAGKFLLPYDEIRPAEIVQYGATEKLVGMIASGAWHSLVKGADRFCEADRRFGRAAALEPRIRVGTIHSVKGSEADNVVMLDSLTRRCEMGRHTTEGRDAEQRVAYVGVTRARKRLVVLSQRRDRWRMELG